MICLKTKKVNRSSVKHHFNLYLIINRQLTPVAKFGVFKLSHRVRFTDRSFFLAMRSYLRVKNGIEASLFSGLNAGSTARRERIGDDTHSTWFKPTTLVKHLDFTGVNMDTVF